MRNGALLFYRPHGIPKVEEDEYLGNMDNEGDMKGKPPGSGRVLSICFAAAYLV